MRRRNIISIILMFATTLLCMTACSSSAGTAEESQASDASTEVHESIDDQVIEDEFSRKMIVVYYSWSENTKSIARRIAENIGADIYEIRTINAYPKDGYETSDISQEERRTGKLPDIENDLPDLEEYDTIIVGGPIWNAQVSTPLARYLELTDFSGKTVIPFSTSMGSGQDSYLNDFKERVQNAGKFGEYKDIQFPGNYSPDAFSDGEIDEMLTPWIQSNSLDQANGLAGDVLLNSGYRMPVLGLGTWTLTNEEAETSVYAALKCGMRLIDTARYYQCEAGVGKGLQRAIDEGIVTRDEVFITSKIMPSDYDRAAKGIDDSLADLGVDYVDLMLIHQPGSNDEAVYKAMEQAVRDGKVRSIGISNYYTKEAVDEVLSYAEIMPAVIQNENHLYYQNNELQEYVKQYGIFIESWYPFGGRGHTQESFNNDVIVQLADKYGKSSAQVILRWQVQAGYIAIPGSSNPEHIAENFDIFDFELSEDEIQSIYDLDRQERYENW